MQYKKVMSIYFLFTIWKKKLNKRKEKKLKREKNKNKNILKRKKLKGKKLVVGVLGAALLCAVLL